MNKFSILLWNVATFSINVKQMQIKRKTRRCGSGIPEFGEMGLRQMENSEEGN